MSEADLLIGIVDMVYVLIQVEQHDGETVTLRLDAHAARVLSKKLEEKAAIVEHNAGSMAVN